MHSSTMKRTLLGSSRVEGYIDGIGGIIIVIDRIRFGWSESPERTIRSLHQTRTGFIVVIVFAVAYILALGEYE